MPAKRRLTWESGPWWTFTSAWPYSASKSELLCCNRESFPTSDHSTSHVLGVDSPCKLLAPVAALGVSFVVQTIDCQSYQIPRMGTPRSKTAGSTSTNISTSTLQRTNVGPT